MPTICALMHGGSGGGQVGGNACTRCCIAAPRRRSARACGQEGRDLRGCEARPTCQIWQKKVAPYRGGAGGGAKRGGQRSGRYAASRGSMPGAHPAARCAGGGHAVCCVRAHLVLHCLDHGLPPVDLLLGEDAGGALQGAPGGDREGRGHQSGTNDSGQIVPHHCCSACALKHGARH